MAIEIKRPGRVRRYLARRYGDDAFFQNGKIKVTYIRKAIEDIESRPPSKRNTSLLRALYLAILLKRAARER